MICMNRYFLLLLFIIVFLSAARPPAVSANVSGNNSNIVVAVDLGHGERDKLLDYIEGNITWVEWKEITGNITPEILADVDILILGQPRDSLTSDEVEAIRDWYMQGKKILWVAGDSDYGAGATTQSICNQLLEAVGSRLRLEVTSIYDNYHNTGRNYSPLTRVLPDNNTMLDTSMLSVNITKPILMHGPTAVIWVDENGVYHDPVNETFSGLVRIVWSYDTAYVHDNKDPQPYLYDPGVYGSGNHTFVMVAAEVDTYTGSVVIASGETPYGGYVPMYAWNAWGTELDGPQFIKNMFNWFTHLLEILPFYERVANIMDPIGDDTGTGTVTYPTNPVFQPGVFDLTRLMVLEDNDSIYFLVTLKNLGDNPWSGPNGFSVQYVHIYILTTDDSLPKNTSTYGLNVEIWHGWNYAILLTPGWSGSPVPGGQEAVIYDAENNVVAYQSTSEFTVYTEKNSIIAKVSKTVLSDVDNIGKWVVFLAVTGYDGTQPLKVRPFAEKASEWSFGGADPDALNAGVFPYIVDVLATDSLEQYIMLTSYNPDNGTLAKVYGVNLTTMEEVKPPTPTKTVTVTTTSTVTTTQTTTSTTTVTSTVTSTSPTTIYSTITSTKTITEKETETVTSTKTETYSTTKTETTTETSVETKTVYQPQTDWTITVIVAIITLAAGLGVGFLWKR